jgi:hypothetical protein
VPSYTGESPQSKGQLLNRSVHLPIAGWPPAGGIRPVTIALRLHAGRYDHPGNLSVNLRNGLVDRGLRHGGRTSSSCWLRLGYRPR